MTLRAAIYARYSDEIQNPSSIADQVSMCRKYVEAQGWVVTEIYADAAMTGRTANRPEFIRLRQDASNDVFDVVIVEAVNRFSRRVVDSLQNWELLTFSGVKLVSVSEGEQNFLNVLLNALGAQMFSEKIADHTRRGLVGALEREGHMHSLAYGYRKVEGQPGVREIDPETAPIVLRIFGEAAEGKSGDDITRGLNRDGVPAPQGGIWYASTIRGGGKYGAGLLRKTIYAGTVTYGRTENRLHPETGARRIAATPDKQVTKEVPELRIVPQELWDRVQARLAESAQAVAASKTRNPRAAHRKTKLLSGLLKCGCCGRDYIVIGKERYGCTGYRAGACVNGKSIRQGRIETRVFDKLRAWFLTPELTAAFDHAIAEETLRLGESGPKSRVKTMTSKLKKLERKRDGLLKAIMDGASFGSIQEAFAAREAETAALKDDLAEAEQAVAERATPPPDPAAAYARSVAELERHLGDPDLVHQAHEHLAVLIGKIVLTPDDSASDGIAAEIQTDLGRFLCAGLPAEGETPILRRFRTIASQLTVTLRPMARHGSLSSAARGQHR